jgi:tetratricopeptide (TPR) repeat protein
VWERWLASFPELTLLDLDVGRGQPESRSIHNVGWLTSLLMPADERALKTCVEHLAGGEMVSAGALAMREADRGALLRDVHLLAGAFHLAEGRLDEAVRQLRNCYQSDPEPGMAIRRMFPSLRLLVRITPCVLFPLYPNAYGAELLYAVALWRHGEAGEALDVLRDMASRWGLYDEIRLAGGIIHLERGHYDRAINALTVSEVTNRDAIELSRVLYLAYAHYHREEYRRAARLLAAALSVIRDVNPHLLARARLLLAELYERNKLILNALRESGRVSPDAVPGDVARAMLAREERWVAELGLLTDREIERLANVDAYLVYLPDQAPKRAPYSSLDTTRNPAKTLKPRQMSWLKRRKEERVITAYRAALARGEDVSPPGGHTLSPAGVDIKARIKRAEQWWPSRRQTLMNARPGDRLARQNPAEVGHLRFDFRGAREAPRQALQSEKRAQLLSSFAIASLLIFLGLWVLQTCVY